MCVCVCTRVCVHACVHMHVCAGVCTCSEHYLCVCRCMSVEEAGAGEWGENARERFLFILYLLLFYMYLLEPMCQRKILIFMLCILMNNKDLFDLKQSLVHSAWE